MHAVATRLINKYVREGYRPPDQRNPHHYVVMKCGTKCIGLKEVRTTCASDLFFPFHSWI